MSLRLPELFGGAPRRLAHRLAPLWIGDAARARAILAGRWKLAGRELAADPEAGPWRLAAPSKGFGAALHRFGWLDDLAAADTAAARRAAQSWTFGWIARFAEADGPHWAPEIAGPRLRAWLERSELILREASADLERRFAGAVHAHERRLSRAAGRGEGVLEAAAGALLAELALSAADGPRRRAAKRLAAAADAAVAQDGGLAARNPEALGEALVALVSAERHLHDAGVEAEEGLTDAVHRLAAALRALRLRDGALPRFHGGGPGAPARLDHALALVRGHGGAERRDAAMGFTRLSAGRTSLVVDAAAPPETPEAHAATLAFELAHGTRRLVVNCGPGAALGGEWAAACRATAAQSTLSLDGVSSSRIAPDARGPGPHPFAHRPRRVGAETAQDLEGSWFLGAHDGWLDSHGLVHSRRLFLSPDGRDFRGEDLLEPPDPRAGARAARMAEGLGFSVRFHLPPEVAAVARADAEGVLLALPEGAWRVTARGGALELAESVYLDPALPAPVATKQVVVTGVVSDYSARVTWGFRRLPA